MYNIVITHIIYNPNPESSAATEQLNISDLIAALIANSEQSATSGVVTAIVAQCDQLPLTSDNAIEQSAISDVVATTDGVSNHPTTASDSYYDQLSTTSADIASIDEAINQDKQTINSGVSAVVPGTSNEVAAIDPASHQSYSYGENAYLII